MDDSLRTSIPRSSMGDRVVGPAGQGPSPSLASERINMIFEYTRNLVGINYTAP